MSIPLLTKQLRGLALQEDIFLKIANLRTMIEPWTSYLMNVAD